MSEKRPTVEEIDAETEELLQRATTLKEKVIEDTMEMVDGYLPKNIQEWRERHPRPLNEQNDRPWQEIMAELMSLCDDIIDGDKDENARNEIEQLFKENKK